MGGGILALAGVAFSITGPGALLAFALNGGIAVMTALNLAGMATRFPPGPVSIRLRLRLSRFDESIDDRAAV